MLTSCIPNSESSGAAAARSGDGVAARLIRRGGRPRFALAAEASAACYVAGCTLRIVVWALGSFGQVLAWGEVGASIVRSARRLAAGSVPRNVEVRP